jgi:hypothetical protein
MAEENVITTLAVFPGEVVRREVIPRFLCHEPQHAQRVVEIRLTVANRYVSVRPGYDDAGRGTWARTGDGGFAVFHAGESYALTPQQLRVAKRDLRWLERITAAGKEIYRR